MLSIKQREERKLWWQSAKGFVKNWRLLWNIKNRGSGEAGSRAKSMLPLVKNMVVISAFPSLGKPIVALKMLSIPSARSVKEELAGIESNLHALRVADLLDNAGIARRFETCEFDNYQAINQDAAKNLSSCRRYASSWPERLNAGTGLVMTGNCGTGKNHLAVSMAKSIIRDHLANVEITDVMRLTRSVKSTWRHNAEMTEEDVIERFASLDLLIIDEVGVQFGSPTEMTILQEIINARYESILPTILISNLTFDQLKETIGERIVDRVTDGGRNRLAFGWGSFRAIASGVVA